MKTKTFTIVFAVLSIAFILSCFASQSIAATYCVANAAELTAALNNAKDNREDDVIKIQQGTYYGNFVYASTESFGVTIEGGHSDSLCTLRDVNPANTVLDAEGSGAVLVLSAPDVAANFVVDGITLQNGNTIGDGGGLYVLTDQGDVTLNNNVIRNNVAEDGGGVLISGSTISTCTNSAISNNIATVDGGGAWFIGGFVIFRK